MGHDTLEAPSVGEHISRIEEALSEIRCDFEGKQEELIPLLQRIQNDLGYLPERALLEIADLTRLPAARVFGVATFYAQFRFQPIGKYVVKVCRGTACHVSGANLILEDLQTYLKIGPGETTEDRLFTLETVACFGSCALAPVVVINDSVYGLMNPSKTRRLLNSLRREEIPASRAN